MTSGEKRLSERLRHKLDGDGNSLLQPVSCCSDDPAWSDRAILCRDRATMGECAHAPRHRD